MKKILKLLTITSSLIANQCLASITQAQKNLFEGIKTLDIKLVKQGIEDGADINQKNLETGHTALEDILTLANQNLSPWDRKKWILGATGAALSIMITLGSAISVNDQLDPNFISRQSITKLSTYKSLIDSGMWKTNFEKEMKKYTLNYITNNPTTAPKTLETLTKNLQEQLNCNDNEYIKNNLIEEIKNSAKTDMIGFAAFGIISAGLIYLTHKLRTRNIKIKEILKLLAKQPTLKVSKYSNVLLERNPESLDIVSNYQFISESGNEN